MRMWPGSLEIPLPVPCRRGLVYSHSMWSRNCDVLGPDNRNTALCGLSGSCATIHWQVDSSDEAALVGSEEHGRRCNLIRCSKSSHWDHLLEIIACTLLRCFRADMDHGRLSRSRTDYVRSNATAGQLCGPGPDKGDQSCFRRRIRAEARYAHLPCRRSRFSSIGSLYLQARADPSAPPVSHWEVDTGFPHENLGSPAIT